jgi:hypothetical protein
MVTPLDVIARVDCYQSASTIVRPQSSVGASVIRPLDLVIRLRVLRDLGGEFRWANSVREATHIPTAYPRKTRRLRKNQSPSKLERLMATFYQPPATRPAPAATEFVLISWWVPISSFAKESSLQMTRIVTVHGPN